MKSIRELTLDDCSFDLSDSIPFGQTCGTVRGSSGPRVWPKGIESECAQCQSAFRGKPRRTDCALKRPERCGQCGRICPLETYHPGDFRPRRDTRLAKVSLPVGSSPIPARVAGRGRS